MPRRKKLYVCVNGKSCPKRDSCDLFKYLKKAIKRLDLQSFYKVKKAECFGLCKQGPIITVEPDGYCYGGIEAGDCAKILIRHSEKDKPIKKLLVSRKK